MMEFQIGQCYVIQKENLSIAGTTVPFIMIILKAASMGLIDPKIVYISH